MKVIFDSQSIEINPSDEGYSATLDGKTVSIQIIRADAMRGRMDLFIDGKRVNAHVSSDGAKRWVTISSKTTTSSATGLTPR